ncbi:MAG: pyrroline-5-carboxylate reductase [Pseudomonadota bacterium]
MSDPSAPSAPSAPPDLPEHLLLLGCGKMGGALLAGWLGQGLASEQVTVLDPAPSTWLLAQAGVRINPAELARPEVALLAVKPQVMGAAAPALARFAGGGTLFVSIAAGTPISAFEAMFGAATPIVRVMPNTPSAIGQGISALIGNASASEVDLALTESLMAAVGETVRLETEDQMDAVTGLSGSGPAYVFHLIEAMAAAGVEAGLPSDLAMRLARVTVSGAGALAAEAEEAPAQLRENVTSPGGTTAAGLAVLMPELTGLMTRTIAAAAERGRVLSQS